MKPSQASRIATLGLGAFMVLAGCKSKPAAVAVRNPDGSITNPDGTVTYPAGSQQAQVAEQPNAPVPAGTVKNSDGSVTVPSSAATTAPAPASVAAPTPAPAVPAAPPPRPTLTLPSGTRLDVSISQTLSASRNNPGDSFTGSLAQAVVTTGGTTVFRRGDRVDGRVVAAKGKGRFKGSGALGIEVTSVGGHEVSTTEYEKEEKGRGKRSTAIIGGGGGLGALIGGLAGGGKGALIGGLAGAGAGTAGAAYTGSRDVVLPAETVVSFRTTTPITVR